MSEKIIHLKDAGSLNARGEELMGSGMLEEAILFFSKAIELNDSFADAFSNRGEAYTRLGLSADAKNDREKAISLRSAEKGKGNGKKQKSDGREIDYLFDELFPEKVMQIDDVYDVLFSGQTSSKEYPAIVEFVDGRKENISRASLLDFAGEKSIRIIDEVSGESSIPFDQISCIRMSQLPEDFPDIGTTNVIEVIECRDGNTHQVFVPSERTLTTGLFGFSKEEFTQFKYYFFPYSNIRQRYMKQYLGEILVSKGMIADTDLEKALQEHKLLKSMKIGQIIAEQAKISHNIVEREIQKVFKQNTKVTRAGEILVATGLFSVEQVNKALATQAELKNKKIGQFLIEKGIIKEEEVYKALADKFRMTFADLRKTPISKKALTAMPRELMIKLKVLPITFQDSTLIVATMVPDDPAIKSAVRQYTKHPSVELVLVRPAQLQSAFKQLFQK